MATNQFDWFNESTKLIDYDFPTSDQYNESFNQIMYEMLEKLIDTDHVMVNENGTLSVYNESIVYEFADETEKKKKKVLSQIKKAMKKVFEDNSFDFRESNLGSFIGKTAYINGSSNRVAISYTKKGRHELMFAISGAEGAAIGLASVVIPPVQLVAPAASVLIGFYNATKAEAKNEKELTKFFSTHKNEIQKSLNDNVTDAKVTVEQMKSTSNLIFTIKLK